MSLERESLSTLADHYRELIAKVPSGVRAGYHSADLAWYNIRLREIEAALDQLESS